MQDNQELKDSIVHEVDDLYNSTNKKSRPKDGKVATSTSENQTQTTETKEPVTKQAFMYLGPNIPGGILFNGSIMKGMIPDKLPHLQDIFAKIPEITNLFVEAKGMPAFKVEVAKQGTEAHRLYQTVIAKINEGAFKDV